MPSILDQLRVVLYEPQKPINIAGTIRAMKNMGVGVLRLVRPVPYEENFIEVIAHDTRDLVARIEHHDSLDAALADCVHVAAFTGKRRAAKWAQSTPRAVAGELLAAAADGPVAVLFGREDDGLPAEALDRAHVAVTIPTTEHASLNIAQAVLVALYELHLAAGDATVPPGRSRKGAGPASAAEFEQFFFDAERALQVMDFFKTRNPEHVMRNLRSVLFRGAPDTRELGLLRSMAFEVIRTVDRVARGLVPPGFPLDGGPGAGAAPGAAAGADRDAG
jgi:TrmH family RNA methyltransferase